VDPFVTTRLPRAGIDPIDGSGPALAVIGCAITQPKRAETIVLLLDAQRRGRSVLVVSGTDQPDCAFGVLDAIARASPAHPDIAGVVMASVRPSADPCGECRHLPGDIDRWLELSERAQQAGLELVEWYLIGPGCSVTCPRDLWGEAPRW